MPVSSRKSPVPPPARGRKKTRGPSAPDHPELFRVVQQLCGRLDAVVRGLERLGGLVEQLLQERVRQERAESLARVPAERGPDRRATNATPGPPQRAEERGQGFLPGLVAPAAPARTAPPAIPDTETNPQALALRDFSKLAAVAGDIVRGDPDREWTGVTLCEALKAAGAQLESWRGMPMKLTASLKQEGCSRSPMVSGSAPWVLGPRRVTGAARRSPPPPSFRMYRLPPSASPGTRS